MSRFEVSFADVMSELKAFQRTTANYAFERMYEAPDASPRFLVADEVGLGKTLVARGVIAKAIEKHEELGDNRIDIVYICSNAAIAAQNLHKLKPRGIEDDAIVRADRLTMLTTEIKDLRRRKVNLIAITPGTSFNLGGSTGKFEERALIYALLQKLWGKDALRGAGPERFFFRGIADNEKARKRLREKASAQTVPGVVVAEAREAIRKRDVVRKSEGKQRLRILFKHGAKEFKAKRSKSSYPTSALTARHEFMTEMRRVLAEVALRALEPDIVVLDEFQRFKHLLDSESDDLATTLAQELFSYRDRMADRQTRTLLLSATPYRPFTSAADSTDDDHYEDFVATIDFLFDDRDRTAALRAELRDLHRTMLQLDGSDLDSVEQACRAVERRLKPVMCRTERLASTADRSGMLTPITSEATLEREDIDGFVVASKVAGLLDQHDVTEYWKSSPYLLSFMEDYKMKRQLRDAVKDGQTRELAAALRAGDRAQLDWDAVEKYHPVDQANGRLRTLSADTVGRGVWQLLWLPPSLRYYDAGGVFETEEVASFTKRLIFSAWNVVPKTVSSLLSLEVERKAFEASDFHKYDEFAKRSGNLLDFRVEDEKPAAMGNFSLLIPHPSLATIVDPLTLGASTSKQAKEFASRRLGEAIEQHLSEFIRSARTTGAADHDWYWAAPLLLDLVVYPNDTRTWWDERVTCTWVDTSASDSQTAADSRLTSHLFRANEVVVDPASAVAKMGPVPADLADKLAEAALGGPATCALRSLMRVTTEPDAIRPALMDGAHEIAWGFRSMFSGPLETAIVKSITNRPAYWQAVLEYGIAGNIQAMLDEYVHTLKGWLGFVDGDGDPFVGELAGAAAESLSMRTISYASEKFVVDGDKLLLEKPPQIRAKFAVHFGHHKSEDEKVISRIETVSKAFNSPFWPFVLSTTSIGQEGLDFHLYSHAVVHWNLPSNPVDFEQREGRVHRYKGHAVRKNVAFACADAAFDGCSSDPWARMFASAVEMVNDPDEVRPYWVFDPEGAPAKIERHVSHLPLSRDAARLKDLLKSVAAYRLSFGQSRQAELVELLTARFDDEQLGEISERLRIDLSPTRR